MTVPKQECFVLCKFKRRDYNVEEKADTDVSLPVTASQMAKKAMLLS